MYIYIFIYIYIYIYIYVCMYVCIYTIFRVSLPERVLRKYSDAFGVIGLLYGYNRQLRHICLTYTHTVEMTNV